MDPRWLPVSEKEIRLHSRLALISGIQPEMDNIEAMSRYETRSSVQKAIDRLKKTQEDVVVYKIGRINPWMVLPLCLTNNQRYLVLQWS